MRYGFYTDQELDDYPIALLVPTMRLKQIEEIYFASGAPGSKEAIVIEPPTAPGKKKPPVSMIKEFITDDLVPALTHTKTKYVICASGDYFKVLANVRKVEPNMGYVLDSPFGDFKVVYAPNFRARVYDPEKFDNQLSKALNALNEHRTGVYSDPGSDIIKFAEYPRSLEDIEAWLDKLIEMDVPLTIDTENFDLKHHLAGIGTITFCWNQHEGIAFPVDYEPIPEAAEAPFGRQVRNEPVRALLKQFFYRLSQKAIYHNIAYDVYVLIYQLFMDHLLDQEGLLEGLEVMLRNWDCTKIISYLATNSTSGNQLSLKDQSQEFMGNYAQDDIHDITLIPLDELLTYNLRDGLATWFVHSKNQPKMIADDQVEIYETVLAPATVDIIQMQLTGLPLSMERVLEVKEILQFIEQEAVQAMSSSIIVQEFEYTLLEEHTRKKNAEWKTKSMTVSEMGELAKTHQPTKDAVSFNPGSSQQLQKLLFEQQGLPILSYTDTKLPSTDGDTIKALQSHTKDQKLIEFLRSLLEFKAVNKIITSFIPAFENAGKGPDGWHYLFGNFNIGGTISGRLSSSKPNLQNLPSNVFMSISDWLLEKYPSTQPYVKKGKLSLGKLIKSCFVAPEGWLFCGLDFDSLEDRISALTTKDPNKLKVYTDGFDGHCLRAFSYFGERMEGIDPESVASINSISDRYPEERQDSKVPTFLLTYGGTYIGIVEQTGIERTKAMEIEERYHELYRISDEWVAAKLEEATRTGYVTVAFGLRVRTPLLKQVVLGNSATPYQAEAEGRTAGNALGQSWCLLNSRAGSEFMTDVHSSKYRLDIKPCAQIHDAQYFLIRDDIDAIAYTNEKLVKAVRWQDHDDIRHDEVKLGGKLGIFYPDWSNEIQISNDISAEEIQEEFHAAVI